MMDGIQSSLSGMTNALRRINVSAHNIANSQTEGFRALRADLATAAGVPEIENDLALPLGGAESLPPSNVNLTTEITNLLINTNAFKANLAALKAQNDSMGVLLDIKD
jgi:flagellar basal body rod protein FlgG